MSNFNESRFLAQENLCVCVCKCRLNKNVLNQKQDQNCDKFQCELKTSVIWSSCENGYVCNPNSCNCECDNKCEIVVNSKKRVTNKLVIACKNEIVKTSTTSFD